MSPYLTASEYIDWEAASIINLAKSLASNLDTQWAIVKACFHFVRDDIKHSADFQLNPVTLKASDVLEHGTGYCYAKSHLLAALLRANQIPAGLCYQRLTIANNQPPFCLHGLNAVFLDDVGWYRLDPRGNKTGVNAQFTPPEEKLAFPVISTGEKDLPGIYIEPLPQVIEILKKYDNYLDVANNLPDIAILEKN